MSVDVLCIDCVYYLCYDDFNFKFFFIKIFSDFSAGFKAHIRRHLSQEARDCGHLVLWLDCDREGENICFEGTHSVYLD